MQKASILVTTISILGKNRNLLKDGETGYFRHRHAGKDDRVFYSISVNDKNDYSAKITRIQYRGPLNAGIKKYGVEVAGALKETGAQGAILGFLLERVSKLNLQAKLDGNWELQAAKIVDAIGRRMAADA
jgi:hypothetical protein